MSNTATTPAPASSYANPLRGIAKLRPERVDQGVDYGGSGPIYALGDGIVENVFAPGWPGGAFIEYKLTDGPAQGQHVFAAEDIHPAVSVGETVTAQSVLGQMFDGPEGIETGWADPDPTKQRALAYSQWGESHGVENSTAYGINFNQLLEALGAPGGIIHGPVSGTVPPAFPTWGAAGSSAGAGTGSSPTATTTGLSLSDPFGSIVSWLSTWALKLVVVAAGGALIILGAMRAVRGAP